MKNTLIAAALALGAACAFASPTTLNFENIASSGGLTSYSNNGFSSQGFDVLFDHGHLIDGAYYPTSYAFSNGTDWLMHDASGVLRISKTGGGLFSLSQFEYGTIFTGTSGTLMLSGTYADNSVITRTFSITPNEAVAVLAPAWSNLKNVQFVSAVSQGYDNIVLDASAVPEPGSLALVALALGGLAVARRRRV